MKKYEKPTIIHFGNLWKVLEAFVTGEDVSDWMDEVRYYLRHPQEAKWIGYVFHEGQEVQGG